MNILKCSNSKFAVALNEMDVEIYNINQIAENHTYMQSQHSFTENKMESLPYA